MGTSDLVEKITSMLGQEGLGIDEAEQILDLAKRRMAEREALERVVINARTVAWADEHDVLAELFKNPRAGEMVEMVKKRLLDERGGLKSDVSGPRLAQALSKAGYVDDALIRGVVRSTPTQVRGEAKRWAEGTWHVLAMIAGTAKDRKTVVAELDGVAGYEAYIECVDSWSEAGDLQEEVLLELLAKCKKAEIYWSDALKVHLMRACLKGGFNRVGEAVLGVMSGGDILKSWGNDRMVAKDGFLVGEILLAKCGHTSVSWGAALDNGDDGVLRLICRDQTNEVLAGIMAKIDVSSRAKMFAMLKVRRARDGDERVDNGAAPLGR